MKSNENLMLSQVSKKNLFDLSIFLSSFIIFWVFFLGINEQFIGKQVIVKSREPLPNYLTSSLKKCYESINGEQDPGILPNCLSHSKYTHLLPCHLGVSPDNSQKPHILVLGSAGRIGLSLIKLLKNQNLPFIEVR